MKRAQDKEGRKNLCWKESGAEVVCKAAHACMDLQGMAEKEVKTKREIKLFFIIIYYKKCNMPGFYGSFYGH